MRRHVSVIAVFDKSTGERYGFLTGYDGQFFGVVKRFAAKVAGIGALYFGEIAEASRVADERNRDWGKYWEYRAINVVV